LQQAGRLPLHLSQIPNIAYKLLPHVSLKADSMPNPIAEVEREFTDMAGLLNIRVIGSLDPAHISKALEDGISFNPEGCDDGEVNAGIH
jgi:hypothetical protein